MRYQITYESTYRYSAPVVGNFNRLRMRPRSDGTQRCEHFDVSVTPRPDELATYEDLFGNEVTELLPPPEGSWSDLQGDHYRAVAGAYRYHPYDYLHENPDLIELVGDVRGG